MKFDGVRKPKTRRGKKFLEDRAPKFVENDKSAFIAKGNKSSVIVTRILHELSSLKKPLVHQLKFKNPIRPFEDDIGLEKFSHKFDSSLFLFGSKTKKHPNSLIFGRMFDYHLLDMVELSVEKFVSSSEINVSGVLFGSKPSILLQGTLFETDETMKRIGNLMVDWFRGTTTEFIRIQGLELVISITATSEKKIIFRVYKAELKKEVGSTTPKVNLISIGPNIDFVVERHKFATESLYKAALKRPVIKKGTR